MPRPSIGDLCCTSTHGCCKPRVRLDVIPADVVAEYETSGAVAGDVDVIDEYGSPLYTITAAEVAELLAQYQTAIDATIETIASRVCMAKYVAGCCVEATVCVPIDCSCSCDCRACDTCNRESVRLDKLDCVRPDRVDSIEIEGVEGASVEWCDGWRLYGVDTSCGGRRLTVRFRLKDPTAAWSSAVTQMACSKLPCLHTASCDREEDRAWYLAVRGAGLTGFPAVDDLDVECCNLSGVAFAGRRVVERIEWVDCEAV